MKIKLLILSFFVSLNFLYSQNISFADINFKNALLPLYDTNADGQISMSEAQNVSSISITTNQNVTNLSGIENFPNLMYVFFKNNAINTPVNLSQNTNLVTVMIQGTTIPSINLNGLTQLKYLTLSDINYGASLDLSTNSALLNVSVSGSYLTGGITSINVSGSPLLKTLFLTQASLSAIDVSQNPVLETLIVQKSYTPGTISSINLTQNPLLKVAVVVGQSGLTSINVNSNPILEKLDISGATITSLNLSSNPLLKYLGISSNNFSAGIDVTLNPLLEEFHGNNASLTTLNLSNNVNLKTLSIINNDVAQISFPVLTQLTHLSLQNNKFTSIDLSNNPNLKYIAFTSNQLVKHLNLKNGNNQNIIWLVNSDYQFMTQLTGVCVDNPNSTYGIRVQQAVGANVLVTANCALLATQENQIKKDKIKFFPNPAEDFLQIQHNETLLQYSIFSATGQKIKSQSFKNDDDKINVKSLPTGIYYIEIKTKNSVYREKFLKK